MTAQELDEIVTNLVMTYEEDFDISSSEQRFVGLKGRIMKAITAAVAEKQERCAKAIDLAAKRYRGGSWQKDLENIANDIRKVKP